MYSGFTGMPSGVSQTRVVGVLALELLGRELGPGLEARRGLGGSGRAVAGHVTTVAVRSGRPWLVPGREIGLVPGRCSEGAAARDWLRAEASVSRVSLRGH